MLHFSTGNSITLDPQTPDRTADKLYVRVLIADDDSISRRMLAKMIEAWGYEVVAAPNGSDAWAILNQPSAPRLAILDWMMPGMTGPALCRALRDANREPYTYVLLLTARTERQDLIEGMESGADDYVTKPFDADELEVRLRAGRRIVDLQAELVVAREALRDQAMRDPLTCVWNRHAILEALSREMQRSIRDGTPIAVMMADLDLFKRINDSHGHLAGDAVLRGAASRMQACLRAYDLVGRYGGEEFLAVLPGTSRSHAIQLGERLRAAVAGAPFHVRSTPLAATVSVGVSATDGAAGLTPEDLIRAADQALYQAKMGGRNRVEWLSAKGEPLIELASALAAVPCRNG